MKVDVSVCVTTFNRSCYLKKAIETIFNQTFKNFEVLVVDDCSTDDTEKTMECLMKTYPHRLKYFRHSSNKGLAAARNTAIVNSKGKFFTFCDDDDTWSKEFLQEMMNLAVICEPQTMFCAGANVIRGGKSKRQVFPKMKMSLKKAFALGYTPPVAGQFYFTSDIRDIGGYDENVKSGVDHDLWVNLLSKEMVIVFSDKPLTYPNVNELDDRITTNQERRTKKIGETIQIWEARLTSIYGKKFYERFRQKYFYYLFKGFINKSFRRDGAKGALLFLLKNFNIKFLYWLSCDTVMKIANKAVKNDVVKPTLNL